MKIIEHSSRFFDSDLFTLYRCSIQWIYCFSWYYRTGLFLESKKVPFFSKWVIFWFCIYYLTAKFICDRIIALYCLCESEHNSNRWKTGIWLVYSSHLTGSYMCFECYFYLLIYTCEYWIMKYLISFVFLCIFNLDCWLVVSIALSDLTCSPGQTYVKFIKNNGVSSASQESFEIYDGSTKLYTSPTFANSEERTIEEC